jgi:hypothetical protein
MPLVLADWCKRSNHSPRDGRLQAKENGQFDDHVYLSAGRAAKVPMSGGLRNPLVSGGRDVGRASPFSLRLTSEGRPTGKSMAVNLQRSKHKGP